MQLIRDKIEENNQRRKKLILLATRIKTKVEEDDNSRQALFELLANSCKGLLSKKTKTPFLLKDFGIDGDTYQKDDHIAISPQGLGTQSPYGGQMRLFRNGDSEVLKVLQHADKLFPFIKRTQNADRLTLIKDIVQNLPDVQELEGEKLTFKLPTRMIGYDDETPDEDENDNERKKNDTKRKLATAKFDYSDPYEIYADTDTEDYYPSELNIRNLAEYILIEEHADEIETAYKNALTKATHAAETSKKTLETAQNKLGGWLALKDL